MKKSIVAVCMAVFMAFVTATVLCVRTLVAPQTVFSEGENLRVVVDAGHGGIDGGVSGSQTGVKESDLNLSIAMYLKDGLEEIGFAVTLTRKTEAGLYGAPTKGFKKRDMQRRKEIIEETKPCMVISLHQNYYPSKSSRGAQVFYNQKDENGKTLALHVQKRLNELYAGEKVKARNATFGDYYMVQCAPYPSIIVECGFLSSPSDEKLLCTAVWQKKLAQTILSGVVAYFSGATA
jgi:N-acetylmuramoyl-L-alanine amidase